jgi:asparagine synthase (glutamine-hydrolysing)
MCGIAGIVALDGVDPRALMEMTHLVSYRGPNGFGFAYAGRSENESIEVIHDEDRVPVLPRPIVGLGSHRLAILDLSRAGNMPMLTDDGGFCLTFNGEIYNYKEIRQELERCRHRFRTGTDTEVILHSYQEWGEACLKRFNGMWSFALWDQSKRRLFCARDRFGVKPFYYALYNGRFFFGSEIKQILQASSIPRVANSGVVFNFLERGLVDYSEKTFFENIRQLPGGHWLKLDVSEPLAPVIERYWELEISSAVDTPVEQAVEEFRHRFQNSIKLRLRSDVPIGVSLSGGLDSSSVVCQAKQIAPEIEFQTFSACFDDPSLDEREYVASAIKAIGGVGHPVYPKAEPFWGAIKSMIYHHDEPLLGTSAFAQWSVMKEARLHGIPVMLGGQGADEALCGYQKYLYFHLWRLLRKPDVRFFGEAATWLFRGTNYYWTLDSVSRYLPGMLRKPFSLTGRLCSDGFRKDHVHSGFNLGAPNGVAERQKTDLIYTSIPALLHHEDRNSMTHSVESRLPFLDYELVEFAVNCRVSLKLRDGWSKWILRSALAGTLPEKIRLRKTKLGFDVPDGAWVRAGLQNGHRELWESPQLRMKRFLDEQSFTHECRNFLRGIPSALPSPAIFRAISLEIWAQTFLVN